MRAVRPSVAFAVLGAMGCGAFLLALTTGSEPLPLAAIWAAVTGSGDGLARDIVLDLRLQRALAALATGGLLALAGALMQVLLRNPLADPYVLGVSGGAAVTALGALMLGLSACALRACSGSLLPGYLATVSFFAAYRALAP